MSSKAPPEPMLEEALRRVETEAVDPVDHPDATDLAVWLDGGMPEDRAAEVEAHLAMCGECRDLVVDVSSFRDSTEMGSPPLPFQKRPGTRWLAAAAAVVMTLMTFRALTVDERLAELGVGHWAQWTTDPELLDAAEGLLDGLPGTASPFAAFAVGEPSVRAASNDPTQLISPRWEALVSDSVVWQWSSPFQAVELWIVDDREQLVLRHPIDSRAVQARGEILSYGPTPELGRLDPDRLYAWKLNFRDAEGRLVASEFMPFRRLSSAEIDSGISSLPPLLAAAALSEIGAHGEALRRLTELEASGPGLRQAARTVIQRRRVPEELLDREVTRWMQAEGRK